MLQDNASGGCVVKYKVAETLSSRIIMIYICALDININNPCIVNFTSHNIIIGSELHV